MTQLSALPILSVQIAFTPTDIQSATQTWTDVTPYVRDFDTKKGKQHYLDRIQASTINMTLNNRTGFFLNGTTNGTGAIISQRLPIKITATYSSTTYPVFYGIIDSIEEKIVDALNTDLVITASDFVKYLSLQTLAAINFWQPYATTSEVSNWYEPGKNPYIVTGGSVVSSVITFTCQNYFSVGDTVIVSGLKTTTGGSSPLNGTWTVASVSNPGGLSTSFTVATSLGNQHSIGNGTVYNNVIKDLVGSVDAIINGPIAFLNNGVLIYDTTVAADMTNGTGIATAYFTNVGNPYNYGIEFWILGDNLQGNILAVTQDAVGNQVTLTVNNDGTFNGVQVSDGYWHHISYGISGNQYIVTVDGVSSSSTDPYFPGDFYTQWSICSLSFTTKIPGLNGYIDQIIVYNSSVTTTPIKNRYLAGSILQVKGKSSADRIAEVLVLAGFGTITSGAYSVPYYYVGNSYQTYTLWTPGFVTGVTTEPYYWDNPVTTSSALDLILQITDTDIGVFYQRGNGTFLFIDQNYFGGWTFTTSTSSVSVGTGAKTFTVESGLGFTAGGGVLITGLKCQMNGTVTSYSGTTLVVNITSTYGSGTKTSWQIGSWKLSSSIAPSGDYVWTDNGTGIAYYGPTTQVLRDDADLWTTVQVNPQAGTIQVFNNLINEPRYGYSTLSKAATVNSSLNAALSSAYYLGYIYQEPLTRVGLVELRAETNNGSTIPAMLGTNIFDVINFQRKSPGASTAGAVNLNMAVESISNEFHAFPGQWHTTFILDPYPVRT